MESETERVERMKAGTDLKTLIALTLNESSLVQHRFSAIRCDFFSILQQIVPEHFVGQ